MSLEKRRETKENKVEKELEGSSFRRLDFTPLQGLEAKKKKKVKDQIEPDTELSVIEKDVLSIAQEILKLKRYDADFDIDVSSEAELQKFPIIEKLYAKSIAKLAYSKGYSKEEIFLTIRSLEEKNWIVTNERRTKLEILNNEKLVKILKFIEENPGIHARNEKIEEELKITRTPFLKHIMTLERFKLIRSKKIGKSLHYFLADVPEDYDKYKVIFSNPLIPKIIEEIFKDEGIAISKIGEILNIYSGTIQYYMKKLKDLDLIKSAKTQKEEKIHVVNVELLTRFNEFFGEPDFSKLLKGL
ncbi:MAG: winged helix-turn-helix transcriptional regulator [Candidatus Lokiarchaeota archaeon]|nr:winged helix-turn-helix transcriptional regulator [Candidatus Lokiarchaeota archaeon]